MTIDVKTSGGSSSSNTVSIANVTTTQANELLVIATNNAISSISGGGLTWIPDTGGLNSWYAFAANILTNITITITYSGSNANNTASLVSVYGTRIIGASAESTFVKITAKTATASSYSFTQQSLSKNGLIMYFLSINSNTTITAVGQTVQQSNNQGSQKVAVITQDAFVDRDITVTNSGTFGTSVTYTAWSIEVLSVSAGMVFKGLASDNVVNAAGGASALTLTIGSVGSAGGNLLYEVPSGSKIVLPIATTNTGTTVTAVSDTRGNTYIQPLVGSNGSRMEIWVCENTTTTLQHGDAISITFSGAGGLAAMANVFYGLSTSSSIDVSNVATGSGTALLTGNITPTQTNEIIVGFASEFKNAQNPGGLTAQSAYISTLESLQTATNVSSGLTGREATGNNFVVITGFRKYATAIVATNFSGTIPNTSSWIGIIIGFKEAGATNGSVTTGGTTTNPTATISANNPSPGQLGGGIYTSVNPINGTSPVGNADPQLTFSTPTSSTTPTYTFGGVPGVTYYYGIYNIDGSGNYTYTFLGTLTFSALIKKKRYYYKIYTPALVYVTTWSIDVTSDPTFRMIINGGAGELKIRLARTYTTFDEGVSVALNNRVELWCMDVDAPNGVKIYTGYISAYAPTIDDENQYLDVTVLGFATNLVNHVLIDPPTGDTTITYTNFDPSLVLKDAIDKYHDDGGTDVFYSNTSVDNTNSAMTYTFINVTIQDTINKLIQFTPYNWFWYVDANGIINMHMANIASPTWKLTVGRDLSYISPNKRVEGVINAVNVVGGGLVPLYNYYERSASIALYGKREVSIQDYRITTNETADLVAKRKLDQFQNPEIRTVLHITDNNGDDTLQGQNIEAFQPGQTLQIINVAPSPILIIQSINYFIDHIEVEASTRLPEVAVDLNNLNTQLITLGQTSLPASPSVRSI